MGFLDTFKKALASGDWIAHERVLGYAAILLFYECVAAVFFVGQAAGWWYPPDHYVSTDFISFYAAGHLADMGTPWLAYDDAAHYAAQEAFSAPGVIHNHFYYPPVFLLICAVLAYLPYVAAFGAFEIITFLAALFVAKKILAEPGWKNFAPILAFPIVFWAMGLGQNAFLTAALLGGATLLLEKKPWLAGALLGALVYKPQFGLLIGVALLAGRHWRALAGAVLSAMALCGISVLLFGWQTWEAFFAAAKIAPHVYEKGLIDTVGLTSPFGAVMVMGGGATLAYAAQAVASIFVCTAVGFVWFKHYSAPLRMAALAAGQALILPVMFYYDLLLGGIAMLWLVRSARWYGWGPYEKCALAFLYLAMLFTGFISITPRFLVAPVVALGLFAVVLSFAAREARTRKEMAITQFNA